MFVSLKMWHFNDGCLVILIKKRADSTAY